MEQERAESGRSPSGPSPAVSGKAGITDAACARCEHWKRNSYREPPPEPEVYGRFLGFRYERDDFTLKIDKYLRAEAIERNNSGWCHRFPEAVKARETHWCAEYSPLTPPSPVPHE